MRGQTKWTLCLYLLCCALLGLEVLGYAGKSLLDKEAVATGVVVVLAASAVFARKIDVQNLLLVVPVPMQLTPGGALVILNDADGKIYRYVMAHGGEKIGGNENETRVKYIGKPIYDAQLHQFAINQEVCLPKEIIVSEE
jgi:hypothetical protein